MSLVIPLGGESLKVMLAEGIQNAWKLQHCNWLPYSKALKSTWWKNRNAHTSLGEWSFPKFNIEQYLKVKGRRRGMDNSLNLVQEEKNREGVNEY